MAISITITSHPNPPTPNPSGPNFTASGTYTLARDEKDPSLEQADLRTGETIEVYVTDCGGTIGGTNTTWNSTSLTWSSSFSGLSTNETRTLSAKLTVTGNTALNSKSIRT